MKKEQCPICYSELEVKELAPCDDCGCLEEEIDHFNNGRHKYNVYEIYKGLKLQLCDFCDIDFGSYNPSFFGFSDNRRLGYGYFTHISFVKNPSIQKDKYCPDCNRGIKFLTFLRDIRAMNEEENN